MYQDAFRVLKPGGRLSISDVVATAPVPEDVRQNLALLTACVGGAATIDDTESILKEAGFQDIRITPKDGSKEIMKEWLPDGNVSNYIVSAYIEAVKPL